MWSATPEENQNPLLYSSIFAAKSSTSKFCRFCRLAWFPSRQLLGSLYKMRPLLVCRLWFFPFYVHTFLAYLCILILNCMHWLNNFDILCTRIIIWQWRLNWNVPLFLWLFRSIPRACLEMTDLGVCRQPFVVSPDHAGVGGGAGLPLVHLARTKESALNRF